MKRILLLIALPLACVAAMWPGRSAEQGRPWFYSGRHRAPGPSGIGEPS